MKDTIKMRWSMVAAGLIATLAAVLLAGVCCVPSAYADETTASNGGNRDYGTDWSKYPVFYGEIDEYGFHILTNEACGCQLAVGESYRVVSDVTLEPGASEWISGLVANNNLIYINAGCTLTVRGSDAKGWRTGLPGIALTSGKNLFLDGEGSVKAYGGKAGDGEDGKNGELARQILCKADGCGLYDLWSGNGGNGGDGGCGAGAGIGTAGGKGGTSGVGGEEVSSVCQRFATDKNGNDGWSRPKSANPGKIENPGQLCIAGNVTVYAKGGDRSTYVAKGGSSAPWFKSTSSGITKHLSGGSGGGGGGAGGSSANGYGKGGEGGGAGGGGGSAGSMWRTRSIFTSDDPPTASGGENGKITSGDAYSGCRGEGEVRTVGSSDCHGGKGSWGGNTLAGSEYTTDSSKFSVLAYGNASKKAVLPSANRNAFSGMNLTPFQQVYFQQMYPSSLLQRTALSKNASMKTLTSYTGFSGVNENGGWYVKNEMFNADAQQTASRELFTIAGITTVKQVEEALASDLPTKEGATFLGWAFTNDKNSLVYDAQTKTLNTQLLVEKKKVVMSSNTEGVWMCATPTPLVAVWQETSKTFSIVYHTNGGTFVNPADGKTVEGDQYTDAGQPLKGSVTLWDNDKIGKYHLNPPASMASTTKLLGWAKKVDEKGYPDGSVYKPGESLENLNPREYKEVHLYAVWKREEASTSSSSAESSSNSSTNSSTDSSSSTSSSSTSSVSSGTTS